MLGGLSSAGNAKKGMVIAGLTTLNYCCFDAYCESLGRLKGFLPNDDVWKPKYPVTDPNPTFTKIVPNFNFEDRAAVTLCTGMMASYGYKKGLIFPKGVPSMVTGGVLGLTAGFGYACIQSRGRLMGFIKGPAGKPQYEVIDPNPELTKIISSFNAPNYAHLIRSGLLCSFLGYLLESNGVLPKRFCVLSGLGGLILAFGNAYLYSRDRLKGFLPGEEY